MPEKASYKDLKIRIYELEKEISHLRSEKNILDEILDNLPGTFYIWDDEPKLIRWNKRHEKITEYSGEEYADMLPLDFFDQTEHGKIKTALEKVFTDGDVKIEATLVTKSGKRIPHLYTGVRMIIANKPVLMGFGLDISERVEAEQQLRAALAETQLLREKLEAECIYFEEEIKQIHDYSSIIGKSEVMRYVLYSTKRIAPTDTTVLILGESGTGKELIARAIHHNSNRGDRPLVKVDCAALPANLIESELFGHERGAFTGATDMRIGRFELANKATIFLDEIGELPLELQKKLLRVLQDGEYERLGSAKVMHTDARIIAATNRNIKEDVKKGHFREDLWYRLNVMPLSLPPLRERLDDIPLLVDFFLSKIQRKLGKTLNKVPAAVIEELKAYSWPGNVRELENVIERAAIFAKRGRLQLISSLNQATAGGTGTQEGPLKSLSEVEKEHILKALEKTHWNVTGQGGAAERLGINPSTLRGRMRKHGIRRPSPRA